jgi:hypothetical protein
MAICNLFKSLDDKAGNFLLFSQYMEDITTNYTDGDMYKVVPTGFVAMNIDYKTLKDDYTFIKTVLNLNGVNGDHESLNTGIPKYFQNCFENACAYARVNYPDWTPTISSNLFWNFMFDGKFLSIEKYSNTTNYVPEIVYYDDISMHSNNTHQGMNYGEIYCYIPTNAKRMNCNVAKNENRSFDESNKNSHLEGFNNISIENYEQRYSYNNDFMMPFTNEHIEHLLDSTAKQYVINTIVVMYSVFNKVNDEWEVLYSNIPMGIYFAGNFDTEGNISNSTTKFVSTSYSTGTSYGLRICTRFSAVSNSRLVNTDIITDDTGYTNICQLMTAMNANLSEMMKISKAALNNIQTTKDQFAMIKNNRTNVPYIKNINGIDYWFVNGRMLTAVNVGSQNSCVPLAAETVEKRIENIISGDETNDYTYIPDPNGIECEQISNKYLAEYLNLDGDFPEEGIRPEYIKPNLKYASEQEVIESLHNQQQ